MRIVCLSENRCGQNTCVAEHGLSLYVECGGHHILFDMGQGDVFSRNAEMLGVDLAAVDMAVISHGHYDHGGGLTHFLEINRTAPVYLSVHALEEHWHGPERYIGLARTFADHPRLRFVTEPISIAEGIRLYPCGSVEKYGIDSAGLTVLRGGVHEAEDFCHEIYLMLTVEERRILFSGCSHRGILNIVEQFRPDVFIGGFHYSGHPIDEALADHARVLDRFGTEYYTCHCTGLEQYSYMRQYMSHLQYLACGDTILL